MLPYDSVQERLLGFVSLVRSSRRLHARRQSGFEATRSPTPLAPSVRFSEDSSERTGSTHSSPRRSSSGCIGSARSRLRPTQLWTNTWPEKTRKTGRSRPWTRTKRMSTSRRWERPVASRSGTSPPRRSASTHARSEASADQRHHSPGPRSTDAAGCAIASRPRSRASCSGILASDS